MQLDGTRTDTVVEMNMSDWHALHRHYTSQTASLQPIGRADTELSVRRPQFVNPFATANVPDTPDSDLTGLTGLPASSRPVEPLVAAPSPAIHRKGALSPPPPQGLVPVPPRQALILTTRGLHSAQTSPSGSDTSQAQAQNRRNLLASALGVIPCARRLPPGTDPSFMRRKIPALKRTDDADTLSQVVDALYPDEDPEPEPSTEPGHGRKHT